MIMFYSNECASKHSDNNNMLLCLSMDPLVFWFKTYSMDFNHVFFVSHTVVAKQQKPSVYACLDDSTMVSLHIESKL